MTVINRKYISHSLAISRSHMTEQVLYRKKEKVPDMHVKNLSASNWMIMHLFMKGRRSFNSTNIPMTNRELETSYFLICLSEYPISSPYAPIFLIYISDKQMKAIPISGSLLMLKRWTNISLRIINYQMAASIRHNTSTSDIPTIWLSTRMALLSIPKPLRGS